ncbi:MAG TPA: hypothetical protein VHT29_10980 [Solirubrobacteraceae bacterium]|nr:hypothetical protein [Solirubrobacteraceae bacterium]
MLLSRLPHPLTRTLALALSLAIFLALLPAAAAIDAQAASACSKRGQRERVCALGAHKGKVPKHSPGKHARRTKRPAGKRKHTKATTTAFVPAICEDASKPVDHDGTFTCADASEPGCADGATPVVHGKSLLCQAAVEEATAPGEEGCEGEASCSADTEGSSAEEGTACEACEHPSAHEAED